MRSVGFFILRHVTDAASDRYWKEAHACVRRYYPDASIVILDDNSSVPCEPPDSNTTVVQSEFPRRGELLFYHYFLKLHPFDIAVFLHDTVFFNSHIEFGDVTTYKMLWEFEHEWDEPIMERALLRSLTNARPLLERYEQRSEWKGCFGAMCVIAHDFLARLDAKYTLSNLIMRVMSRHGRKCAERVIGCMLNEEAPHASVLGNIHKYSEGSFSVSFEQRHFMSALPVIKVWAGR